MLRCRTHVIPGPEEGYLHANVVNASPSTRFYRVATWFLCYFIADMIAAAPARIYLQVVDLVIDADISTSTPLQPYLSLSVILLVILPPSVSSSSFTRSSTLSSSSTRFDFLPRFGRSIYYGELSRSIIRGHLGRSTLAVHRHKRWSCFN